MKNIKKILRIVGFILFMVMALSGVGLIANFNRERYMDKRIAVEQVERKDQEVQEDSSEKDS